MNPRIFACGVFLVMFAACQLFGPADRAAVAQDAATIEKCQELGRACHNDGGVDCYQSTYGACMQDAGLWP